MSEPDATVSTTFWFDAEDDEDRAEETEASVYFIGPDLMTVHIPDVMGGEPMVICFDPRDLRRLLAGYDDLVWDNGHRHHS